MIIRLSKMELNNVEGGNPQFFGKINEDVVEKASGPGNGSYPLMFGLIDDGIGNGSQSKRESNDP